MFTDRLTAIDKEIAESKKYEDEQLRINPLLKYSTSQLKAELKRRKREGR